MALSALLPLLWNFEFDFANLICSQMKRQAHSCWFCLLVVGYLWKFGCNIQLLALLKENDEQTQRTVQHPESPGPLVQQHAFPVCWRIKST